MKENKPWLCILTSSHSTSPRIRSFWLYNIHVGSCGSQARPICCGVTMSSTGNFNSQHFNSGRLNLMYSHALKESGSFKALKYNKKGWWQSWVLAPVLPVGKFPLISPEPALHEQCFQCFVFSGSVWCFTVEILHLRLNNCGTSQSATHQKLSIHEVQAKTDCSEISD